MYIAGLLGVILQGVSWAPRGGACAAAPTPNAAAALAVGASVNSAGGDAACPPPPSLLAADTGVDSVRGDAACQGNGAARLCTVLTIVHLKAPQTSFRNLRGSTLCGLPWSVVMTCACLRALRPR